MVSEYVSLSPLDEARFGMRTAKSSVVTAENLPEILDFCRENRVKLLVARCTGQDLPAVQAMESAGFLLMDTLLYYSRNLARSPIPDDSGQALVRPVQADEAEIVQAIASESFKGYLGHYHADDRLSREACDAVYTSWAYNSCVSRDFADEVLVAEVDGQLAGFATLRLNSPQEGEGVLFGVAPFAQGKGIYRSFMVNGMRWCAAQGAEQMVVSTQITNIAVQKVWVRLGFEPNRAYYTFHRWFDE